MRHCWCFWWFRKTYYVRYIFLKNKYHNKYFFNAWNASIFSGKKVFSPRALLHQNQQPLLDPWTFFRTEQSYLLVSNHLFYNPDQIESTLAWKIGVLTYLFFFFFFTGIGPKWAKILDKMVQICEKSPINSKAWSGVAMVWCNLLIISK